MEENTKKTLVPIFNIIQDINGKYNIHKWDNSNGCYADKPINKTVGNYNFVGTRLMKQLIEF